MKKILIVPLVLTVFITTLSFDMTETIVMDEEEHILYALSSMTNYYKPNVTSIDTFYNRLEVNDYLRDNSFSSSLFYTTITRNRRMAELIVEHSLKYNVPVNVMFAIARVESNFNPHAVNTSNNDGSIDYGLFQLNNSYRSDWSREDFFNIEKNTYEAITYFSYLVDLFEGDIIKSIAAYNAGPGRILNNNIPQSTERYIVRVLDAEDDINLGFNNAINKSQRL